MLELATLFILPLIALGLIIAGWVMNWRLTPEHRRRQTIRWLIEWSFKGLVLPLGLWLLMNVGISWKLQAFMPRVQAAQIAGGFWFVEYCVVAAQGLFVIGTYWSALTIGWAVIRAGTGLEGESKSNFRALCLTCLIGMLLPAVGMFWLGGMPAVGLAACAMLAPIAGYAPAIIHIKPLPPMYSRAIARMKFGKYSEAEWEIISQLEKSQDDFNGWMLMAELYANHFKDLREAEQTILEICDQPKLTSSQLSIALHKLADWQLQLGDDPDAARRALHMIIDRLPGSHLARMAELRTAQLPANAEQLVETRIVRPIPLPALGDSLDAPMSALEASPQPSSPEEEKEKNLRSDSEVESEPQAGRKEAAEEANACVEALKLNPNDVKARERLARLLAERLERSDLAIEQLNLLLNLPEEPESKRAEWLALIAAWHLKYRHDRDTGRRVLERLVAEFPSSPQAFAAKRRLEQLGCSQA